MRTFYICGRIACAFVVALFAHRAMALGLGELRSESHLNEPLSASIEILGAEGVGQEELLVRLASQEDFDRLGVSRDFVLTELRFTPDLQAAPPVIRVTTHKPVQEPSLDFVLEVQTPKTKLLKGFTIFLDPIP